MKKIILPNIDIEIFKVAFSNFKKFVTSDFEFDYNNFELSTNSDDFNKWHLVTLASFYGGDLFRKNNELVIDSMQNINIPFKIDYNSPKLSLQTNWNVHIELNPAKFHMADFFQTKKLENVLSQKSKSILKENLPDFDFEQSVLLSQKKYAYIIINTTLIFILTEQENAIITHLFKVSWNEI